MMNPVFKAFAKKLFGAGCERLFRALTVSMILFWGLRLTGYRILIAPSVLYLMISTFTAGVMWQALSSEDQAAYMQNMLMLPFEDRTFVLTYAAVLGSYTLLIRTLMLLAAVFAVSARGVADLPGTVVCMVHAVLLTACIHGLRRYWYVCGLWGAAVTAAVFVWQDEAQFFFATAGSSILALGLLLRMDGYAFYTSGKSGSRIQRSRRSVLVWRYLVRYLTAHKNYLANTAVLWCAGCALPFFFREMESRFAMPMGFAVLSLNTPLCILLSCDPELMQAVRSLPDGKRRFCVPYSLFLFLCSLLADSLFLTSYQLQAGSITLFMVLAAVFFALLSAVCSVLLEWYYPVRGWKTISDLWHHPRKYAVPAMMLLLAGAVGTVPELLPFLMVLPAAGMTLLLF